MKYWFADDSEFLSSKELSRPDVFVFGGIVIEAGQIKELQAGIEKAKSKYIPPRLPIKWNIKDLKKVYEKHRFLDAYEILLENSQEIRRHILLSIKDIDFKIIVSAIESTTCNSEKLKERKSDLGIMAFIMGLQRFGLELKSFPNSATVVLDWPDKGDNTKFNHEYANAYNFGKSSNGQTYHCKKLSDLGFNDSIFYTTMLHSSVLQLSDLIVGVTREFLETLSKPEKSNEFKSEMFNIIKPKFRGFPDYYNKGLIISNNSPNLPNLIKSII